MLINLGIDIGLTMYSLNNVNSITTILIFCKIRIYVFQATSMMYRWVLVVDRYATSSASVHLRNHTFDDYEFIQCNNTFSIPNKSPDRISIENFLFYLVEVIVYSFPVSSFYLYTMVSKMFREEFKRLLCSAITCKWNNSHRIEPTINNSILRIVTKY
jgi:hypothetical protein